MAYDDAEITVEVTDDGRGPSADRDLVRGHGLAGMRERVAMYGGDVSLGAGPDGGFRVRAVLPRGVAT